MILSEFGNNIMFPNAHGTYLRTTMTDEYRLHELAFMYVHKYIEVYVEECVDLFE